jgi:hypothetical protein
VLPSICSLVAGWRALHEGDVDRRAVARWLIDLWATRLERGLEVRRRHDPARFFDLHFREILADPLGAAVRVYEHFGLAMNDDAARRLRRWQTDNPRGKHGEHVYRAGDFGLTDTAITERFDAYVRQFGIEREPPA